MTHNRRYWRVGFFMLAIMLLLPTGSLGFGDSLAQSDSRRFPETGKVVQGKFLKYWDQNGGIAQQGFPISDEMQERSDTDGKTYTVQYFERAVFELHPENAGTQYEVLLSLLGNFYYADKYPKGAPEQISNSQPGSILFPETRKRLGGPFLKYWQSHGGLSQQGYPISDEFVEVSALNGKSYLVQYFERAVFELHPENAGTQYEVLLSQLGTFRYKAKYLTPTTPTPTPAIPTPTPLAPPQKRSTQDLPDDISGAQIHVFYVVPSDRADRALDTSSTLSTSVGAFQRWLREQTGGRGLRLDTYKGTLDISFFRLSRTDAEIRSYNAYVRDQIESELKGAGFNAPNKIYAVYYDGSSTYACGGGAWPPSLKGNVAAMYIHGAPPGAPPCDTIPFATSEETPNYQEFAMIHEIMHTIGFVATCAPHHVLAGHVSDDPRDLMYAGAKSWQPSILDIGHDDYYKHSIPGCLDLDTSPWLEP